MTTTATELLLSRYLSENEDNPSAKRRYRIWNDSGTLDESAAETAFLAAIPSTYRGLDLVGYEIEPVESESLWIGTADYGKRKKREDGYSEYEFDIGVQNEKRTQSLATTAYTASGTAPNYQGAIGVAGDRVEGVDIQVPTFGFSETHYVAASLVDGTFKANIFACAAKTNSAIFRGFAIGELIFLGAQGALRRSDQYAITYRFEAQPNVSGRTIGGISGISKKGWEFLETLYGEVVDTSANNFVVRRPKAVYVHQVYETANFATLLGI